MGSLQWLDRPVLQDPVALIAFEGWGDAGESACLAASEFLNKLDAELFAIIDPDDHFDFQVRRPIVELDATGIRSISWPRNELYAGRGMERDMVILLGEVPHYLSNQEYPPATEALAIKASELCGVTLDIGELALASRQFLSTVDAAIE